MAKKPQPNKAKRSNPKARQNKSASGKQAHSNHSQGRRPSSEPAHVETRVIKPLGKDSIFLHGRHPVEAALKNSKRECLRLLGTKKALMGVKRELLKPSLKIEEVSSDDLNGLVSSDSPHQGIVLEVRPLAGFDLLDLEPLADRKNIILMLDQVTDPHNVGACIRSAAALGARAIITQDRYSPIEGGVLARAAAGGLETLPWVQVANLAQALDTLKNMGYWHVGLDGGTNQSIRDISMGDNIVLVMGSEGKGMRPLIRKSCDLIAKIPMTGLVESLNVSNAAAIALYEMLGTPKE
ncbi:23S rRNA (guanosine(2251)-2'-O)-methyltransferase RlmB [Kordiimonas sp. SCSIO 12610]|uniref:23S rRNA (guanosine(2251)-2'-O)-methyltransferase RlmB n=1 Tax=Kordiimonas sp. SCSIO 12610 TaxID=2829597 RepID=UPI002109F5B3|nr:23S rRNA (guanosine(2251)-2'-O)-methyltransferase RlmB [Kordiimonas sp. SCSIO 12610]UTW54347.1 23S rRNA (guanosine(2251)-2'-O)-methyltransferase RlmB [Kordiimonas sp. SCSIO 12610]